MDISGVTKSMKMAYVTVCYNNDVTKYLLRFENNSYVSCFLASHNYSTQCKKKKKRIRKTMKFKEKTPNKKIILILGTKENHLTFFFFFFFSLNFLTHGSVLLFSTGVSVCAFTNYFTEII